MRPLLPTLRERKRYLAYEIITATPAPRDLSGQLLRRLAETLGVFGAAKAGLLSVAYDPGTQTGILRAAHTEIGRVRAALLMVTHLGRQEVLIRTLGVSGAVAGVRRFLPPAARITMEHKITGLRDDHTGGIQDAGDATPDDGV